MEIVNKAVIDLQKFRTTGSKVFTGRDRGISVRSASHIDDLEKTSEHIDVIVPDDIRSINPSFLEEFLFNVVRRLGESQFHRKFSFISNGRYKVNRDLDDAIDRILRDENALV